MIAVLSEGVLHDAVPVVASGDAEERQESHAEVSEVGMFTQTCNSEKFDIFLEMKDNLFTNFTNTISCSTQNFCLLK